MLTRGAANVLSDPAHDLQAMDRAYRFGQTRDVSVFRLLGAGSVEELIYARQLYKQQQMTIGYDASIQTRFGFSNRIYIVLTLKPDFRYFEGVQNDKTRQGELFGIKVRLCVMLGSTSLTLLLCRIFSSSMKILWQRKRQ